MKITDLTLRYIESYVEKGSLSEYEASHPALFEHYFTYWGDRDSFKGALDKTETQKRRELLSRNFLLIERKMSEAGFDVSDLEVVLFVGQGWTNGHAFEDGGGFKVFLPIEGYETDEQVLAFVPHEIIHALHYQKQPNFYFKNKKEKEKFSRLLATEGLATLLTKEIMGLSDEEALWADYLKGDKLKQWMRECEARLPEIYECAMKNFEKSDSSFMFYTADEENIFKYRAGYYAGMKVVEEVKTQKGVEGARLLTFSREKLEKNILTIMNESM